MAWMLSCIGCGTKKLPDKEEIEVLDFQHYSLTTVPPYVFECERFLEELYLDCNQITELPKELFLCHGLQILSVSDNDLHNIPPAISSLNSLTSLDISKNGISDIPDSIKGCKKLRAVNASTNPLCRLPEGFTQLVALKELSLSDTFLEYLPANFGRLSGLEVLELRENQLNTLPRSMTRLTALKRLDLGQNEFTELPEVVGHLTSLTDLWIDSNRVKRIPAEIGRLPRLAFLDATKNRINEVDEQIGNCTSLADLYLTANELEELPDMLCHCTQLCSLHVDDNQLEHLPDNLGSLVRLVELKASQNELSALPPSVGLLRSLQFMHVDDNTLTSLPGELGSCSALRVLTAARNRIKALPAEAGSLAALRVLNLCGNSISILPVSFSKLQLSALWLSENQAKPSVPLQCINDSLGQKVLTCFMLPQSLAQSPALSDHAYDDDRPLTEAEIEARRARSLIHFAADGEAKPSRLSRVPTPYPKELRALAKHTKNILALRKEKYAAAGASKEEREPLMKDAQKISAPSENLSALITLKTSSAPVKVASTVASESAIKPASPPQPEPATLPQREAPLPVRVITPPAPLPVRVITPLATKKAPSPQSPSHLCQNGILSASPSQVASSPVTEELPSKSLSRESPPEPPPEAPLTFNKSENLSPQKGAESSTLPQEVSMVTTPSLQPSSFVSPTLAAGELSFSFRSPSESREERPILTSLRPASIAVTDFASGPTPPSFRGSYPLRPGSLALEGVMPPWQKQRPGSLAAPINIVGIPPPVEAKRAVSYSALYRSQLEEEPLLPPDGAVTSGELSFHRDSQLPGSGSPDVAPGTRNGPYGSLGLVSIINRVTEEPLEEDQSQPHAEDHNPSLGGQNEKPGSRIPQLNVSVGPHLEGPPVKLGASSPGVAYLSRIPYTTQPPKGSCANPPRITSPEGPVGRPSVNSPQGPPRPHSPSFGIPAPKVKSNIPTLASPPAMGIKSPTGTSRFEWPKVSHGDSKEVISPPRGAPPTRIAARTPSQTDRESFIPVKRTVPSPVGPAMSPVEKPINQTGIPPLKTPVESPDKVSRIPTFSNSSLRAKTPPKEVRNPALGKKTLNTSS